ncbi:MAG: helix-hairpin-helix domain-containing protein, partial [Acutalibacteraceae bacterium]
MEENRQVIKGFVEDIVFRNPENGYSVIDISCDGKLITAVGSLASVCVGEELSMSGEWTVHPSFGTQFKVSAFERKMPKTAADMLRYLSAGTVKGIGPVTASRIVERFGDETFDVLENDPQQLALIKGISQDKAQAISDEFKKQFAVREVMIFLEKYGMTPTECLAAYKAFGMNATQKISENPYILCRENIGISFSRADEIAEKISGTLNPVFRERAGIVHIIRHNLSNGHTCLPRDKIIEPACQLLSCGSDEVEKDIDNLIEDKEIVEKELDGRSFLFLPGIYLAEKNISDRIKIMLQFPPPQGRPVEEDIDEIEEKKNIHFEEKQRLAIMTAVKKGLLVLTGGPGTGKTTTLNGILELYEKRKLRVLLAAPTGRAAKRMSEVTGREAKTLHRLLEVVWSDNDRQTFSRNMQNPLEADAVIVDELSMV